MTETHDFTDFAADIIAIIESNAASQKITRNSRNTRNTCSKSLSDGDNSVTTQETEMLRLGSSRNTQGELTRNAKISTSQPLSSAVTSVTTVTTSFQQGRAPNFSPGNVANWPAILDGLVALDPPDWASPVRWQNMISDTDAFLARWAGAADQLGWTTLSLFGVHPLSPADRYDAMGLLLVIQGGEVVALTDDTATIRRPSRSILSYRRCDTAGAVCVLEVAR